MPEYRQVTSQPVPPSVVFQPQAQQVEYEEVPAEEAEIEEKSATVEANGDDLADLFKAPSMDDPEMQTEDLISVDLAEDVMGGDLEDLVEVSDEDIMGPPEDDFNGAPPKRKMVRRPMYRRTSRVYQPPTSLGGMQL